MKLAFLAAANSIHGIRWVQFFAERGHDVTWISLAPPLRGAESTVSKTTFHEISPSPLTDINGTRGYLHVPGAVRTLRRILHAHKPELLHIHSAGMYGLVGTFTKFHPVILTPWGTDILLNRGVKKLFAKYVVRNSDFFTCDGENTRKKLIEFGAPPENISLIRFGVDLAKFSHKSKIERRTSNVRIISLRTLIPIYDIETLIRAATIVVKDAPDAEFVIAGDGEQKVYLENLARELGVEKSIKFFGRYNPNDLPAMLSGADIYVSTALSDSGLAASTAEAMAAGLPAVVTDTGDNREWVMEKKGGFVVPCRDPGVLAARILILIKGKKLRQTLGAWNRNVIEEKNNYQKEMAKTEKIYSMIAAASRGAGKDN